MYTVSHYHKNNDSRELQYNENKIDKGKCKWKVMTDI